MPDSRSTKGKYKDILLEMEVGDSVVATFNEQAGLRQAARVLGYKIGGRKLGNKFERESNFRVWRLK